MSLVSTQSARLKLSTKLGATLGVAMLSLVAASVQAKSSRDPQVVVRYSDLDLSKQQDAKALYSRLQRASSSVCGWYDVRDTRSKLRHQACYDRVLDQAVADVGHSAVAELHSADRQMRLARNGSMPKL